MALALSAALLGYFWFIGYPIVSLLHTRRDLVRNALIAPAVGVVVTIYSTYVLSRLGLPVGKFGHALSIGTLVLSAVAWLVLRPIIPGRHLAPYAPLAVVALLASGWPLVNNGFSWLGSVNSDMTNYVLDAQRLVDQPYIQHPDPQAWRNQTDWSVYYVVFPVIGVRSGAQLLFAWLISITRIEGISLYMPLIVTLNLVLIGTAAALVSTPRRYARAVSALVMSLSAMMTLGIVLQLIAQVLGLVLVALSAVLFLGPFYRLAANAYWRFIGLGSLSIAVLVIGYPEMLGFFGIAFLIHHGIGASEVRRFPVPMLTGVVATGMIAAVLIAAEVLPSIHFFLDQAQYGTTEMRLPRLFPYFLIPSGLAALWGLTGYVAVEGPTLPAMIVAGALLSALSVACTCWLGWRREPAAAVSAITLVIAPLLYLTDNGFGALKLAMYAQPFLLPTMTLAAWHALASSRRHVLVRGLAAAACLAFMLVNARNQELYLSHSAERNGDYRVMLERLAETRRIATDAPVMLDIPDFGMSNVAALYARGRPSTVFAGDRLASTILGEPDDPMLPLWMRKWKDMGQVTEELQKSYRDLQFPLPGPDGHRFVRYEFGPSDHPRRAMTLIAPAGNQSVVNGSTHRPQLGQYYLLPLEGTRNYLAQVGSSLGHSVMPRIIDDVALWPWEPDGLGPGRGMQAMGRHLLFEVVNPVPGSRMLLDVTTTPLASTNISLSRAAVIGTRSSPLGFEGRGAGRMLSEPVTPRKIDGHFYVALDMGVEPRAFPNQRTGLAALYNQRLNLDPRQVVGFARNISLLSEDEADAMEAPAAIKHFPADLYAAGLLYSGVYEDGWMADVAKFRLGSHSPSMQLHIAAVVPGFAGLSSPSRIEVLVDGRSLAHQLLNPGPLELRLPIPPNEGPRWVEIKVDGTARLPAPDGRMASIRLQSIALEDGR